LFFSFQKFSTVLAGKQENNFGNEDAEKAAYVSLANPQINFQASNQQMLYLDAEDPEEA
jgi:hypothetical protein